MPSPAEIANDMAAQAASWDKRDKKISAACRDAAQMIRALLDGERVDGRSYHGLFKRLLDLAGQRRWESYRIADNLHRARNTLHKLYSEANRP